MSECSRCGFKPAASPVPDSQQQSAWNIDVLELVRSGHTPPSAVVPSIPGRIAELETRYQAMKDDLTSLVVLVARLRQKMESTEAEIEQIKSLSAPIRSLPREILLHIFSLVDIPKMLNPLKTPCSLGHVCRVWRTLSRSAPCLWSEIQVRHPDTLTKQFSTDVFQQHLVLSNPRPLKIELRLGTCRGADECPKTDAVMELLSGHISRVHSLLVSGGRFEIEGFFRMISKARLRILKSLTVTLSRGASAFQSPSLDTYILLLPPSVHSIDMNLPLDAFRTVTVYWPSLTSFTGLFPGPGSFHRFIVAARSLQYLKIYCIGDAEDSSSRPLHVHENLTDLILTPSCSMSLALDKVSLPRLVNLTIGHNFVYHGTCPLQRRQNWEAIVTRLLDRSQCKLQDFATIGPLSPSALTPLWRMSSLVSLCLFLDSPDTLNQTATVLDILTVTPSRQHLPRLRTLSFLCDTADEHLFTDSKLLDLIASRWEVPTEVQRLAAFSLVNFPGPEDLGVAYEALPLALFLLDLADKGLKVSWVMGDMVDVMRDARKARDSYF